MRRNLVVSGWIAAAVVAIGAGIGAVALAQGGTLAPPTEPLSEEQVRERLAEAAEDAPEASDAASPTVSPSPGPEPSPPAPTGALDEVPDGDASGGEEVIATDGGTVLARCTGSEVDLVWWVAAQGWSIAAVDPGPGPEASFTFTGTGDDDDDDGLHYKVACAGGAPVAALQSDDDDDADD